MVIHQLRERRACFGELVQIDGSPHDWFEGRAERCVLLVFIDDASAKLLQVRFVEAESFFSCFAVEPRSSVDAHRPLTRKDDLARFLTWQESLTLPKNPTLQFDKVVYQIQSQRPSYALRNAQVTFCRNAQQQITIWYHGKSLPFSAYKP